MLALSVYFRTNQPKATNRSCKKKHSMVSRVASNYESIDGHQMDGEEDPVVVVRTSIDTMRASVDSLRPSRISFSIDRSSIDRIESEINNNNNNNSKNESSGESSWKSRENIIAFGLLTLNSLGIVYGDISTSVLYTLPTMFESKPSELEILGALSMIIYSLFAVVTIKYCLFVMRMDNDGEGGILALAALIPSPSDINTVDGRSTIITKLNFIFKRFAIYIAIIGAAFVLGDGIITPSISVLSSMEDLGQQESVLYLDL